MPNKYEALCEEFAGTEIRVMKDGHLVSRQSDWILYSVPAEFIDSVVATYGPCKFSYITILVVSCISLILGTIYINNTSLFLPANSNKNWSDCGGPDIGQGTRDCSVREALA
jgi:hypothetical protein